MGDLLNQHSLYLGNNRQKRPYILDLSVPQNHSRLLTGVKQSDGQRVADSDRNGVEKLRALPYSLSVAQIPEKVAESYLLFGAHQLFLWFSESLHGQLDTCLFAARPWVFSILLLADHARSLVDCRILDACGRLPAWSQPVE